MWTVWKRQDVSLTQQTFINHPQGKTALGEADFENELNLASVLKEFTIWYILCCKAYAWLMVEFID